MKFHYRWMVALVMAGLTGCAAAQQTNPATTAAAAKEAAPQVVEFQPRGLMPNTAAKLEAGDTVRLAYMGGTITSAPDGWRAHTTAWFKAHYPRANVEEISSAVAGTGVAFGAFRFEQDVLAQKPSAVFIEYAVSDADTSTGDIYRGLEGIVRQAWKADPSIDIVFVYTLRENMLPALEDGRLPAATEVMERIAGHYDLPSLNIGAVVAEKAKEGRLVMKAPGKNDVKAQEAATGKIIYSDDGVHPNAAGNQLIAAMLDRDLGKLLPKDAVARLHPLKDALVAANYENAQIVPMDKLDLPKGFAKLAADDPVTKSLNKSGSAPAIWVTHTTGETLTFKFHGTTVGVYDLLGPDSGQIWYSIDDGPPQMRTRFDSYSTTHRLAYTILGKNLADDDHTLKLGLSAEAPDKAAILSRRGIKMDKPEAYRDNAWYVSGLLVVGEAKSN